MPINSNKLSKNQQKKQNRLNNFKKKKEEKNLDTSLFLACKLLSSLWHFRHRRLVGLLAKFAELARIQSVLEPAVGDGKERADIAFFFSSDITMVDVTVVHGQCPTHLSKASKVLGLAAWAEKEKLHHYERMAREEGKRFVPVVFETTGGIGPLGEDFFLSEEMSVGGGSCFLRVLPLLFSRGY